MIRPAAALSLLALCLAVVPAKAQIPGIGGLGGIVNKARSAQKIGEGLRSIGEAEEIRLGSDLAGMLLGAAPLIEDPAKQQYVNTLGKWLALHSERPNLPWKFGIVESDDYNAFSTPGGYVIITRGLFDRMRNESELAGVLAHEVAHVVRKHHVKALQKGLRDQALSEMRNYFSVSTGSGLADQFTNAVLSAGKDMYTQGLDHEDEYEADRMAVVIAARSGYSPYGLGGVLQTLTASAEAEGYGLHNRTHPLPLKRIARLDSAMGARLDKLPGLVDDLASFVALRAPPPPPPAPAAAAPPKRGKGTKPKS